MGDPKQQRKKYRRPKMPWREEILGAELEIMGNYGLRNKRELWKVETELSRIRKQARALLAAPAELRSKAGAPFVSSLQRRALIGAGGGLDEVLSLRVEDIMERRLQTVVWRKGFAKSIYQARQFITHGHITVEGRIIDRPGYEVKATEEPSVSVRGDSPIPRQLSGVAT